MESPAPDPVQRPGDSRAVVSAETSYFRLRETQVVFGHLVFAQTLVRNRTRKPRLRAPPEIKHHLQQGRPVLVKKKGLADVEREHLLVGGAGREDVENETKSQSCARSFRARILATLFSLRPEVVREVCVVPSPPFAVATHRDHVVQVIFVCVVFLLGGTEYRGARLVCVTARVRQDYSAWCVARDAARRRRDCDRIGIRGRRDGSCGGTPGGKKRKTEGKIGVRRECFVRKARLNVTVVRREEGTARTRRRASLGKRSVPNQLHVLEKVPKADGTTGSYLERVKLGRFHARRCWFPERQ